MLRWATLRRWITLLGVLAVFGAGIAQAAHFHKASPQRASDEARCALCVHADKWAGTPELPRSAVSFSNRHVARIDSPSAILHTIVVLPYDARGPPRH